MRMWVGGHAWPEVIERTFRCMLPAAAGVIVLANTCIISEDE